MMERGDSLAVDLGRWDLECEASELYKGFVSKSRLTRVFNKAVKCNAFMCEEEVRYIEFKSPDERALQSNSEMRWAFQVQFCDRLSALLHIREKIQKVGCQLCGQIC